MHKGGPLPSVGAPLHRCRCVAMVQVKNPELDCAIHTDASRKTDHQPVSPSKTVCSDGAESRQISSAAGESESRCVQRKVLLLKLPVNIITYVAKEAWAYMC